jgi:hypothetical protein
MTFCQGYPNPLVKVLYGLLVPFIPFANGGIDQALVHPVPGRPFIQALDDLSFLHKLYPKGQILDHRIIFIEPSHFLQIGYTDKGRWGGQAIPVQKAGELTPLRIREKRFRVPVFSPDPSLLVYDLHSGKQYGYTGVHMGNAISQAGRLKQVVGGDQLEPGAPGFPEGLVTVSGYTSIDPVFKNAGRNEPAPVDGQPVPCNGHGIVRRGIVGYEQLYGVIFLGKDAVQSFPDVFPRVAGDYHDCNQGRVTHEKSALSFL